MTSVLAWSPDTLWLLLQKAWWFLVVLGVLVAFHELGHFLAARWVGVKVLKFSSASARSYSAARSAKPSISSLPYRLAGTSSCSGRMRRKQQHPTTADDRFRTKVCGERFLSWRQAQGLNFILAYLIFAGWLSTGAPLFVPTFRDLSADVEALVPGSPASWQGWKSATASSRSTAKTSRPKRNCWISSPRARASRCPSKSDEPIS